jgi:glycosyltransferase involved in cell wall biosynthesis
VFAVSRLLVDDFRPRTKAKIVYLPNGLEESFLNAGNMPRPANLPTDKPIIGCIGQINITYDWKYIAELAAALPEMTLCFVGNITEGNPYWRRDIVEQLAKTPNILWLDRQPHEQVPAYMQHFDISICLLKADAAGDRRSPLRLYDYLTTERPIISTPVREAYEHLPHIHIAESGNAAATLARRILAGEFPVDVAARKKYVEGQTWANRAEQFMNELQGVLKSKSSPGKTSGEPFAGVGIS